MTNIHISINPLAEYLEATAKRKRKILEEQQNPDPVRIPYYQLARARIKQSIESSGSLKPVNAGIKELNKRKPLKDWQKSDKINSIKALELFSGMLLPQLILENKLELISVKQKHITFNGVRVKVSPNIVFRIVVDGVKHIGACKIHLSKGKIFSTKQSKLVAAVLELYLSNCVAEEDEYVNPVLCFCLDPFAGTTINSNNKVNFDMQVVKEMCQDILQTLTRPGGKENVA